MRDLPDSQAPEEPKLDHLPVAVELVTPLARGYLGGPVWSPVPAPDGQYRILFADEAVSGSFELFVINVDGTGLLALTDTPHRDEHHPTWAPAGDAVVCAGFSTAPDTSIFNCFLYELGVVDFSLAVVGDGSLVDLPRSPLQGNDGIAWPDWSQTADVIAVSAATECCSTWDVWLIDLFDPAHPINITGDSSGAERQPSWSPDDAQIVYWKQGNGPSEILVMNADGTNRSKLSKFGMSPAWRRY
jgi:Tol biopolymer transport system component